MDGIGRVAAPLAVVEDFAERHLTWDEERDELRRTGDLRVDLGQADQLRQGALYYFALHPGAAREGVDEAPEKLGAGARDFRLDEFDRPR